MDMRPLLRAACAASMLAMATLATAHHSSAMFDSSREIELKGVVKLFKFENPHVNIVVTVRDEKGGTTDWYVEGASVRGLAMAGWRRSTLKEGDAVTIIGRPLRDGQPGASLVKAILADGTTLAANAGRNY